VALAAALLLAAAPSPSPPPDAPVIRDVAVAPQPVHAGKPMFVVVHASPDVTSLQAHVLRYTVTIPKTGTGTFSGSTTVPWWARLFRGSFHVTFVARDGAGAQTQTTISVRI
jgi:hypothetical protein